MNFKKQICNKRQSIRLHIQSMQNLRDNLRDRAKTARTDPLKYQTARTAADRLQTKIEHARRELDALERTWKW